jgi:hypothetical protein
MAFAAASSHFVSNDSCVIMVATPSGGRIQAGFPTLLAAHQLDAYTFSLELAKCVSLRVHHRPGGWIVWFRYLHPRLRVSDVVSLYP